jgi:hypothetical protein
VVANQVCNARTLQAPAAANPFGVVCCTHKLDHPATLRSDGESRLLKQQLIGDDS